MTNPTTAYFSMQLIQPESTAGHLASQKRQSAKMSVFLIPRMKQETRDFGLASGAGAIFWTTIP